VRPEFDVVVVGAGPSGVAAAMSAARGGASVCLVERGPFPGAKNVYGGVFYGRILESLVPRWWEKAPVQRWITRRSTMMLTGEQAITLDVRAEAWCRPPHNGVTVYRPQFDAWFADEAVRAGVRLVTSTTVTGLLRDADGRITGVTTDRDDGAIGAKVVIAADGVNSFLAKAAGLKGKDDTRKVALGVKEVLALPACEIEARFAVDASTGADYEILGATGKVSGGGFLYTNRDTLSLGLVLELSGQSVSDVRPEEALARLKSHPAIRPLVAGAELVEYAAHLLPEGGYDSLVRLGTEGLLVVGDAAGFCLAAGIWLEGMNYAVGSGIAAGEAAVEALSAPGRAVLARSYVRRLNDGFVLRDLRRFRAAPSLIASHRVQQAYPRIAGAMAEALFTVDNPEEKPRFLRLLRNTARQHGVSSMQLIGDAWRFWRSFR
jgi:electron transfer flavoprotein-quinone oxidoreductase